MWHQNFPKKSIKKLLKWSINRCIKDTQKIIVFFFWIENYSIIIILQIVFRHTKIENLLHNNLNYLFLFFSNKLIFI